MKKFIIGLAVCLVLSAATYVISSGTYPVTDSTLNYKTMMMQVNAAFHWSNVQFYGATGDGTTDDITALEAATAAASAAKCMLILEPGKTYAVSRSWTSSSLKGVPVVIDGNGATVKARSNFSGGGGVMNIENPHAVCKGFEFKNVNLDANGKADYGLYVHGCQFATFRNIYAYNALSHGIKIFGSLGYGVYYNAFENCDAGVYQKWNGGSGWDITGDGAYYVASNTFTNDHSAYNVAHGYNINYASGLWAGCEAEKNNGNGWNLGNTVDVTVTGGYSEVNHKHYAMQFSNYTGDGTADTFLDMTTTSYGVKVIGGRHIGVMNGTNTTATNTGNVLLPNYLPGTNFTVDKNRNVSCGNLQSTGGIGLNTAGAVNNGINFSSGAGSGVLAVSGTSYLWCSNGIGGVVMRKPVFYYTNTGNYSQERAGVGSPNGSVSGKPGDTYRNVSGGPGTCFYVKESGVNTTSGWVGK